jgi:hypothetical protein
MTGTMISAYGPGGTSDLQGITVDARDVTKEAGVCAFVVKGGFEAKQQIHGLNLMVQKKTRAICDENGEDLMDAVSLSCDGAKGRDCDFKDVSVLVQPDSDGNTPDDDDDDNDGVADSKDLCKGDPVTGGEVGNYGCPNTKCVYFTPGLVLTPVGNALRGMFQMRSLSVSAVPSFTLVKPGIVGTIPISHAVVKDKTGEDSDGDGIDDACDQVDNSPDPCVGADTDGDETADVCDEDIDGDGIGNTTDPAPYDPDADADGTCDGPMAVANRCEAGPDACPLLKDVSPNPDGTCGFEDSDGDGVSDPLEQSLGTDPAKPDTDDDGTPDGFDCLPKDGSRHDCAALVVPPADTDGDGVADASDNCPDVSNADQADADDDGTGDACAPTPEPSGSDKPPAAAAQSCGLQLVAPPAEASAAVMPFLSLVLGGAGLALLRRPRKRP